MHHNSQKRIYGDYIYFITCNVQDMNDFFKEEIFCDLWMEKLKLAKEIMKFELYAFCLNYNHFHFLIKPDKTNYSQIMHFFKRHTSRNINIILGYNKIDLEKMIYSEGDVSQRRLRNDDTHHRMQQRNQHDELMHHRIREFNKIIYQYRQKYIAKFGNENHHPKFKWQKSFYDHIIRDERDYDNHWRYTMHNFQKHNLPENWKYTGLKFAELIDEIE